MQVSITHGQHIEFSIDGPNEVKRLLRAEDTVPDISRYLLRSPNALISILIDVIVTSYHFTKFRCLLERTICFGMALCTT